MQAVEHAAFISVEDYLAGELKSQIRHEYIGGFAYAMAETGSTHNIICQNLLISLHPHLRDKPCHVFICSLKLRLRIANEVIIYYPDLVVTCDPRDTEQYFVDFPKVVIEVFSRETGRVDRHEKFTSYTRIESLEEYILVAQDHQEVTIFRRANNWRPEIVNHPQQQLRIASLDLTISLEAIYERVLPRD
jgi:Uma2 family endonuclease